MSDFPRQLVLGNWLLKQLGVEQFQELSETLHHKELSGFTEKRRRQLGCGGQL